MRRDSARRHRNASQKPSAVRRYFDNKEELLLELAERGWQEWRDAFTTHLAGAKDLTPTQTATALGVTVALLQATATGLTMLSGRPALTP